MYKTFTVVVPTLGRETLLKTLDSIPNIGHDIEVIVVADTFEMHNNNILATKSLAYDYGAKFVEINAGKHDWGSPQLQKGYELATGAWVLNCGDDDIYEPFAFATISRRLNKSSEICPRMFRTVLHPSPVRGNEVPVVLWHIPSLINKNITGQCLVIPNIKDKIGSWNKLVDYGFICETIEKFGGNVVWCEEVISQCY